jgi:GDP-D-mannose dehydratase
MEEVVSHLPLSLFSSGAFWKQKGVFITGHTGFMGNWLTILLHNVGAQVHYFALDPKTPSQTSSAWHVSPMACNRPSALYATSYH